MKMTVALLRVSTDKQDTQLQKNEILNYCNTHNIKIDKWIENIESGRKKKLNMMQGIKEIKTLMQEGLLGKLIVYRQDRISRRAIEVLNFIDELNKQGVEIYATNKGKIETDKVGLVVSFMDAYVSEIEVENTRERIISKLKTKNENNEYAGGNINYGYRYNSQEKKFEVNEEEAAIVKRIFNEYLTTGVNNIAYNLRQEGIRKRASKGRMVEWSPSTITKLISNRIYIGYKEYGKGKIIVADGEAKRVKDYSNIKTHDYNSDLQIIDNDLFNKVQEIKKERKSRNGFVRKLNRSNELLEGLVWHRCSDGKIRKTYISYNYARKTGKPSATFKCNECATFKLEGQKSFIAHKLTDAVEKYVQSFMGSIDAEKVKEHLNKHNNSNLEDIYRMMDIHNENIKKYSKRLQNANDELIKYFDGESGLSSDVIQNMIDTSKKELNKSKSQLSLLELELKHKQMSNNEIENLLEKYRDFNKVYKVANFENKRLMLRECIEKIIVEKDKIEVVFKLNNFLTI